MCKQQKCLTHFQSPPYVENYIDKQIKKVLPKLKMWDHSSCTTVVLTLGCVFAIASPHGGNGEDMRRQSNRGNGMGASSAVQRLPDLYWNTSNPM